VCCWGWCPLQVSCRWNKIGEAEQIWSALEQRDLCAAACPHDQQASSTALQEKDEEEEEEEVLLQARRFLVEASACRKALVGQLRSDVVQATAAPAMKAAAPSSAVVIPTGPRRLLALAHQGHAGLVQALVGFEQCYRLERQRVEARLGTLVRPTLTQRNAFHRVHERLRRGEAKLRAVAAHAARAVDSGSMDQLRTDVICQLGVAPSSPRVRPVPRAGKALFIERHLGRHGLARELALERRVAAVTRRALPQWQRAVRYASHPNFLYFFNVFVQTCLALGGLYNYPVEHLRQWMTFFSNLIRLPPILGSFYFLVASCHHHCRGNAPRRRQSLTALLGCVVLFAIVECSFSWLAPTTPMLSRCRLAAHSP
jgi:hypothetical protein